MVEHWMTAELRGANGSFQRAAREYAEEYAEEYAAMAVAAEREAMCTAIKAADDAGECQAEDLYVRLEALSKALESSGRIDEYKDHDAYATLLDAMMFVSARRGV